MKRGITAASVAVIVLIILILAGTITVSSYNSVQNAKKLVFAIEIANIQEEVTKYHNDDVINNDYPTNNNLYTLNLSSVQSASIGQFSGETKDASNQISLYEVDLSDIGITDTTYGNKKNDRDVYVLSKETGKVYYIGGVKAKNKTYYTLTQDLIDIKNRNEKTKENAAQITGTPVITTGAFTVNTSSSGNDIYLKNIKIDGEGVTKVKYEKKKISESNAYAYFQNNGTTLNNDRIKVKEGEYVTIYAENSSGNWSIKYEGIPTIPKGFYYVGGSIPTGLVISDNAQDANLGTSLSGDVASSGLSGNQFVWIPVDNIDEFVRFDGYCNDNLSTMVSDGYITEPFSGGDVTAENDTTGEYAEYAKMHESVEKYHGFYIARYEAGSSVKRESTTNGGDGTTLVPSKKGQNPYNYVGWGKSMTQTTGNISTYGIGCVELARYAYPDNNTNLTGAISTLIYGVQWDAAVKFTFDINNTNVTPVKPYYRNSTSMGWYSDNYETGNPEHLTGLDLNGGKNKVKNIYDMGGNIFEWTMEAWRAVNKDWRVKRGGYYTYTGLYSPQSFRNYASLTWTSEYTGFRIAIYIK